MVVTRKIKRPARITKRRASQVTRGLFVQKRRSGTLAVQIAAVYPYSTLGSQSARPGKM